MELTKSMHRTPSTPVAWIAATLCALAVGFTAGWYVHPANSRTQAANVTPPPVISVESQRIGGPGGQIGDADPSPRVGGPAGQIGDTP